jgi:Na+/melibiose symporter-like transporter
MRFKYMIIASVFIFSLKKFIENPAGITFIMSIPYLLSIFVGPVCSFVSDRIWTRWGRRKPFIIPSMVGVAAAFIAMPLMPNIWGLLIAYLVYQVSHDMGNGPYDILKQEVVPPKQRGTAAAIGVWIQNIATLAFNLIAIGRFDDFKYYAGFPITGEESIYWGIAAALLMMAMLVAFGIKETYQPSKLRGERFTVRNILGGLLNRNLWPVYLLITGWIVTHAGLGSLGALLYVEQWGFTKQEMGINVAVGTTINIFLIVIIGFFADKLPRMKTFEILLFISILIELSFYLYVEFILFDKTPSLPEVILFGEMASIAGILLGMLYMPLVYDYVPRNEMGTFTAGSNLVGKSLQVITLNGVGVFIALYSSLFMPPGGDMVRVALNDRYHEAEILNTVRAGKDTGVAKEDLTVEAWYATNAAWEEGTAFEIRRKNGQSLDWQDRIEDLNSKLSPLLAKKSNAEAQAERALLAGDMNLHEAALEEVLQFESQAAPVREAIEQLTARQEASAGDFLLEVKTALADHLMTAGDQITAAYTEPATLLRIPLSGRPESSDIARTLNRLRLVRPDILDLRPDNTDSAYFLEASLGVPGSGTDFIDSFAADFKAMAPPELGELLATPAVVESTSEATSIVLEMNTIEDPTNNHLSPVTRFIYAIWNWVGDAPTPQRRVWATARALRDVERSNHVGAWDISEGTDHRIRVQALYDHLPDEGIQIIKNSTGAASRIKELLGADHPRLPAALDLYKRSVGAAAQNRLTIPSPVLGNSFAPPKYDYMSGYLWMVIMSSLGLGICMLFTRRERKGLIRKRGVEESEAEAKAEAMAVKDGGSVEAHETYYPGCVSQKIVMLLFALAMTGFGLVKMGPDMKLILTGDSTTALASHVVKERIGGSAIILSSDAAIAEARERFDRSWIFWNHFKFTTPDGREVAFRAPTGKQLEPEYPILNQDGLPTAVRVFYDPGNPHKVVIPGHFSTWFLSGLLVLFGTIGTLFSIFLLRAARKPIQMPIVRPKDAPA